MREALRSKRPLLAVAFSCHAVDSEKSPPPPISYLTAPLAACFEESACIMRYADPHNSGYLLDMFKKLFSATLGTGMASTVI